MTTILKTLAIGIAAATCAIAFAQNAPPNPASPNPATGAGQRSSQDTPMGTTGTPGGGAAAQGSSSTSGSMSGGSTAGAAAGSTGGSGASSGSMSGGTAMAGDSGSGTSRKRQARADRN